MWVNQYKVNHWSEKKVDVVPAGLMLNPHFRAPVCLDLKVFIRQETPRPGAFSAPAAESVSLLPGQQLADKL